MMTPRYYETRVAGVSFDNRQQLVARLKHGEPIQLIREPNNPHDPNAIAVKRGTGEQLGYVPAYLAAELAQEIDRRGIHEIPATITGVWGASPHPTLGAFIGFTLPAL